ncbi:conserved Plasmodium protein, unknown function [Plasmodium sp. gorilla clade G2]|uniref:conserved Plasmodium protein, unknown function n=1 Tax=Plasmodium sp. gorilla clade G2 TaxID=880535 RepID=UPI000D210ECD|nr:conserved Plasmodium protein, unknown function [Plasmodium sp. gorilla clade G2]SOV17128.1 conserved Plasmodium protein, unknown function [Plasmodium sp. gorilla clade G2]
MKYDITRSFRIFLRLVLLDKECGIERGSLNELKRWGREQILKNKELLNEYISYREVLNEYTKILNESKTGHLECNIEKVANHVGLTTKMMRNKE